MDHAFISAVLRGAGGSFHLQHGGCQHLTETAGPAKASREENMQYPDESGNTMLIKQHWQLQQIIITNIAWTPAFFPLPSSAFTGGQLKGIYRALREWLTRLHKRRAVIFLKSSDVQQSLTVILTSAKASNKTNTAGKQVRQRCHSHSHLNHVIKCCDLGVSPPVTQLILTLSPSLLRCVLGSRNGTRTGFRDSTCPQQRANHYAVI